MKERQFIRDEQGTPLFVVLPMAEYERLAKVDKYGFPYDDETDEDLISIEVESSDNEDAEIPNEVVGLMLKHDTNLLGAWRIYCNLSQQEVAEKLGLSQSAISQMERRESKPQRKTLERLAKIYHCDINQMYL